MSPVPTPPPDLSGGFMEIAYSNGTDRHSSRIHVLPFSTARFAIGGGTPSVSSDDGAHDYAYQPDRPAGQEAGVADTFAAAVNVMKQFYHNDWTFTLQSLWQNVNGTIAEVPILPITTPQNGTSANADVTGQLRACMVNYNFKTAGGHRARVVLVAGDEGGLSVPDYVTANTGAGSNRDTIMVAYFTGQATAVVGHDNQKLLSPAHRTFAVNRRLRRHYGFA